MQSFNFLLCFVGPSTSSEQDGNKPPGNLAEAIHSNFVVSAPCDITKRQILPFVKRRKQNKGFSHL